MTVVERLAEFAVTAPYEEIFETVRQQLKIRILDSLGCAIEQRHQVELADVEQIDLEIFDIATKEQAGHTLPYILAVAVLDGTVMPEQYRAERIRRSDVQENCGASK